MLILELFGVGGAVPPKYSLKPMVSSGLKSSGNHRKSF